MTDSFFGRIGDLIVKPARLMDNVGADPRWWQPGVVVLLAMTAFVWIVTPIQGPEQMEVMRDSRIMQMMPEEAWQQQYDQALDPEPISRLISSVGGGFSSWVMILVFGFVLGFFARMGGGQGSFRQALGITSWASLIMFVVGSLVKLPLVVATESVYRVNVGLAALVPGLEPTDALYPILQTYGDFFTWWALVVLIIGFERVFQMKRGAAVVSVLLPWALFSAVPVALQILFM